MASILDSYTDREFNSKLNWARSWYSQGVAPTTHPQAFLLGGQSGAGKTTLHHLLSKRFEGNAIVINGDEYRKSHPRFEAIQQQYGLDAPAHTAAWSGAMTEALVEAFSAQGYNLIIEGTLRTSEVPLSTARLLNGRSYSTSLAIMAVKPEISLLSCNIRFELMRIAGTTPRATDPQHHDKIVHDIVENLSALETCGLFDDILLYDRAGTCLYPIPGEPRTASETLREILFGPWTGEEIEHYHHLQDQLELLRA